MTVTGNDTRKHETGIGFAVRGKQLILADISRLLRIEPHRGFEAGDPYVDRLFRPSRNIAAEKRIPFGVWHFVTTSELQSDDLEEHAIFLIKKLEPAAEAVNQLISDPDYFVKISVWCLGYTFGMTGTTLAKLSSFAEYVAVTCWDIEAKEEANTI